MKLAVLPNENFSCRSCTDCCRRQMVELFAGEPEKIEKFIWPAGDPLIGVNPFQRHGGKTYFAHRPDGSCVFLNQTNGLCRVHEEFGPEAKCIACRIFPFQITPTFAGEASISARYDCPTVRRNEGEPHAASLPLLRKFTDKWVPGEGFDEATRCRLDRNQIEAVAEFLSTLMNGLATNPQRALFIPFLCDVLSTTAPDQLNRQSLATAFVPLKKLIEAATEGVTSPPGIIHRAAFRTLLGLHLRRDEDILDGRASRVKRLFAMIAFVFGFGSFRGLGLFHPAGGLRRAQLFKSGPVPDVETFALLWRLIRNRLDALQFMGAANGGRDFLTGLRSLALLYPLVLAAARHHAATRASKAIDAGDVDYAVTAIEHSFARAAVLGQPFVRSIERLLGERGALARLVRTV
jgi:Fe-S-cluster containining protein